MTIQISRPRNWISLRRLRNNIDLGRVIEPIEDYDKLWLRCWMDGGIRMESVDEARMNDAWTPRPVPEYCIAVEGNFSKFPSFSHMSGLFTSHPEPDLLKVHNVPLKVDLTGVDRLGYSTGPMFELPADTYLTDGKLIDRLDKVRVDCRNFRTMFNREKYEGKGNKKFYHVQVEEDYQLGYYQTKLLPGRHTYSMIDVRYKNWKHTDAIVALDQINATGMWEPYLPHMMNLILCLYRNEPWDYVFTDDPIVKWVIEGEIEEYKDSCKLVMYRPPESSSIQQVEQVCHLGQVLQNSGEYISPMDAVALKLNYEDDNIEYFKEEGGGSVLVLLSHHREYARDFAHMLRKLEYSALATVVYNLHYKHDHKRIVGSSKIPPFENLKL